jgi:hypothetical protein
VEIFLPVLAFGKKVNMGKQHQQTSTVIIIRVVVWRFFPRSGAQPGTVTSSQRLPLTGRKKQCPIGQKKRTNQLLHVPAGT